MLTKKQFDILEILAERDGPISQRNISQIADMSLGIVNKNIGELSKKGYISNGMITKAGLEALEPYRVKRAIFIAAGFGSRMVPITLNTPKPLIRVNGKRIIDTLLDAVVSAGIEEIYIVRGYLAEQFDQLLYKYPTIKFIENPIYNESNNISSAVCARHLLKNAYVLEADMYLYNPALIKKYQYSTNYLGVPVDETDDWCFTTNSQNVIKKMSIGGTNCYRMYGISYWSEIDGIKLSQHVKEVYQAPGGKERYWDQVPLEYHISDYNITVRPCKEEDIIEIDTYNELKEIDKTYSM